MFLFEEIQTCIKFLLDPADMHACVCTCMNVFSAFQVSLNRENKGPAFKAYIARHAFKISLCELWIVTHILTPGVL